MPVPIKMTRFDEKYEDVQISQTKKRNCSNLLALIFTRLGFAWAASIA